MPLLPLAATPRFKLRIALALLIMAGVCIPMAQAQTNPATSEAIVPEVSCPGSQVRVRVMQVARSAPGQIDVNLEFESVANVPQSVDPIGHQTFLLDDVGDQYKLIRAPRRTQLLPGSTTKASYQFRADIGGKDARSTNLQLDAQVRTEGSRTSRCALTIRSIPIGS